MITTNQKSIVLVVEILPADARGNRKILVSGAPKDEMPVLRAGLFADRHAILDDVYRQVMKRAPQTIKHKTAKPYHAKTSTPDEAEPAEQGTDDPAAVRQFEEAVASAKAETDATDDQLVAPDSAPVIETAPGQFQFTLPVIENDPTAEASHG